MRYKIKNANQKRREKPLGIKRIWNEKANSNIMLWYVVYFEQV